MDDILTNVMVYWTTKCITSSCRLYYAPGRLDGWSSWPQETMGLHPEIDAKRLKPLAASYVAVPTGVPLGFLLEPLDAKDLVQV